MHDPLSLKFAALADPTRRAMLARLAKGQATVSQVAEPFLGRMSLPAVTKHLKVLENAGLVVKTHDAQRRLCDVNSQGLRETAAFLEQYRQMWEESLDRLGEYLQTVTKNKRTKAKEKPKTKRKNHGRKRQVT